MSLTPIWHILLVKAGIGNRFKIYTQMITIFWCENSTSHLVLPTAPCTTCRVDYFQKKKNNQSITSECVRELLSLLGSEQQEKPLLGSVTLTREKGALTAQWWKNNYW